MNLVSFHDYISNLMKVRVSGEFTSREIFFSPFVSKLIEWQQFLKLLIKWLFLYISCEWPYKPLFLMVFLYIFYKFVRVNCKWIRFFYDFMIDLLFHTVFEVCMYIHTYWSVPERKQCVCKLVLNLIFEWVNRYIVKFICKI